MVDYIRKFTAPISIILFMLIFSVSFIQNYGQPYEGPILLNSKFKYFTKDPETSLVSPYLWEVVYYKGDLDRTFIRKDAVDGVNCLGMHVYQDGVNDTNIWATIHLKQMIGGQQLTRLLDSNIGVWVYPTFPYISDKESKNPDNVFGIEINDGVHIIWLIFSDQPLETYTLKNHYFKVIPTPLNEWSYRELNIKKIYETQGWQMPDSISFILIMGATRSLKGEFAGYVKEIVINEQV